MTDDELVAGYLRRLKRASLTAPLSAAGADGGDSGPYRRGAGRRW
jgi:hypothetical protein